MKKQLLKFIPVLLLISHAQAHDQGMQKATKDGQGVQKATKDVVGQGSGGAIVSADGATLLRTRNGITASLSMPTPVPGSYIYPPGNAFQEEVIPGHPEVFTGWMFVFNHPEQCSDGICGGNELDDTLARGGAYNFAGHPVGGPHLTLTGHVSVGSEPFVGVPLDNPAGAEVHLAVAPHGMVQPALLPTQINTPIGTPAHWWLAIFLP